MSQQSTYGNGQTTGGKIPSSLSQFVPMAQIIQSETGIPASITLAQLIQESGTTLSGLATKAFNLFGIKGTGPNGSVYMPTTEYVNGQPIPTTAQFKKYSTYMQSMEDHAKLLQSSHYAQYFNNAKSVNDYAQGLQKAGYATDPNYANELIGVISTYDLHAYDNGASITFNPSGTNGSSSDSSGKKNSDSVIGGIFFATLHVLIILGLFIGFIVFVVKSFPALEDVAPDPKNLMKKAVSTIA